MGTFMKQRSANIDYELTDRVVGKYRCCPNRHQARKEKALS